MPHIAVVGSLNMDLVVEVPSIPQPGETVLGQNFATFPGGKGANQAVAAARLGAQVNLIGRVGRDPFGDQLLTSDQAGGIEISRIGRDQTVAPFSKPPNSPTPSLLWPSPNQAPNRACPGALKQKPCWKTNIRPYTGSTSQKARIMWYYGARI